MGVRMNVLVSDLAEVWIDMAERPKKVVHQKL